jgi:hypothetical protein
VKHFKEIPRTLLLFNLVMKIVTDTTEINIPQGKANAITLSTHTSEDYTLWYEYVNDVLTVFIERSKVRMSYMPYIHEDWRRLVSKIETMLDSSVAYGSTLLKIVI